VIQQGLKISAKCSHQSNRVTIEFSCFLNLVVKIEINFQLLTSSTNLAEELLKLFTVMIFLFKIL